MADPVVPCRFCNGGPVYSGGGSIDAKGTVTWLPDEEVPCPYCGGTGDDTSDGWLKVIMQEIRRS